MSGRDWDAELRKIDQEIARVSSGPAGGQPPSGNPAPSGEGRAPSGGGGISQTGGGAPVGGGALTARGTESQAGGVAFAAPKTTSALGVYARLGLAVALGVGIVFWPYAARCGLGLAAYLGAVLALVVGSSWSAIWTWRHRAARAHTLSLILVLWGLILAGIEVLPRTGYAIPTASHPAVWSCSG